MGQLTNLHVSQSYQGLVKLANSTTGVTNTLQYTQDGLGNNLPLQISTDTVNITGSFLVNGLPIAATNTGSLVTTASFNAYTSSVNTHLAGLDVETGSLQNQINGLATTGSLSGYTTNTSFNNYTSSNDTKVNNLIAQTGSYAPQSGVTALSSSIATTDLSQNNRLNSIESITGSFATTSSLTLLSSSIATTDLNQNNVIAGLATTSSLTSLSSSIATTDLSQNNRLTSIEGVTGSFATTSSLTSLSSSIATTDLGQNNRLGSLESKTGSYATTGSNIFNGNQTITGSVNITGNISATSASFTYITTIYETASVIYSSGSNQFGDASNDTQTLWGRVDIPTGPVSVTGSVIATNFTGSLQGNASTATSATYIGGYDAAALAKTGSNTFIGTETISGSLIVTGSWTNTGTNNGVTSSFLGNVMITGSGNGNNALRVQGRIRNDVSMYAGLSRSGSGRLYVSATDAQSLNMSVSSSLFTNEVYDDAGTYSVSMRIHTTTTGSVFSDWDNGIAQAQVPWLSLAPNINNNPTPQMLRGLGITGSLNAPSITGSLQGTASYAIQALSASYAPDNSNRDGLITTGSAGGSQSISSSLNVSGTLNIATGSYLQTDGITNSGPGEDIEIAPRSGADVIVNLQNTIDKFIVKSQSGGAIVDITGSLHSTDIVGTGSLFLQPNQTDARYLEVYNTSPTDTHITASGGQIFLGNDVTYVKVDNYGSVKHIDIVADNGLTISSSIVNLTGSLQITAPTGTPLTVDHNDATAGQNTFIGFLDSGSGVWSIGNSGTNDDFVVYNPQTFSTPFTIEQNNNTRLFGNLGVTGSVTASAGFNGNLQGTASYATQALSASWAPGGASIDTGSFATTGSNTFIGNQNIVGSVSVTNALAPGNINIQVESGSFTKTAINLQAEKSFIQAEGDLYFFNTWGPASSGSIYFNSPNKIYLTPTSSVDISGSLNITGSQYEKGNLYMVNPAMTGIFSNVSSSNGGNILFGWDGNTAPQSTATSSYVISGSNNILKVWQPLTSAGYNNYISGSNNINLGAVGITLNTSSLLRPATSNNYIGGQSLIQLTFATSSVAGGHPIFNNNIINNAVTINMGASGSITATGNIVNGATSIYQTGSAIANLRSTFSNNNINSSFFIQNYQSSSFTINNNNTVGAGHTIDNSWVNTYGTAGVTVSRNLFQGQNNYVNMSGSPTNNTSRAISDNFLGGNLVTIASLTSGSNAANSYGTIIYGYNLQANANSTGIFGGSAFFGRFNDTGSIANTNDIVFAVGTGTAAGSRRTGLHITTGSIVNVSGSLNVIGNQTNSGSLIVSGSATITGSVQGNVLPLTVSSNTASLNLNNGNFYELSLTGSQDIRIEPSNIKPGQTINIKLNTTGSGTVSFPTSVKQPSGSAYVPTTAVGTDIITMVSFDTTNLFVANVKNLI